MPGEGGEGKIADNSTGVSQEAYESDGQEVKTPLFSLWYHLNFEPHQSVFH